MHLACVRSVKPWYKLLREGWVEKAAWPKRCNHPTHAHVQGHLSVDNPLRGNDARTVCNSDDVGGPDPVDYPHRPVIACVVIQNPDVRWAQTVRCRNTASKVLGVYYNYDTEKAPVGARIASYATSP